MCGTPSEESHGSLTSHACERADGCHGGPGAAESLWNPGGLRFGRAYALRVRFLLTFSAGYLSILSKQTTTLSCVPGGCEHIHEHCPSLTFTTIETARIINMSHSSQRSSTTIAMKSRRNQHNSDWSHTHRHSVIHSIHSYVFVFLSDACMLCKYSIYAMCYAVSRSKAIPWQSSYCSCIRTSSKRLPASYHGPFKTPDNRRFPPSHRRAYFCSFSMT
jgi:hypothetical protein